MSISEPDRERWSLKLKAAQWVAEMMGKQAAMAPSARPIVGSPLATFKETAVGELVRDFDRSGMSDDDPVRAVLSPAVYACRTFLGQTGKQTTATIIEGFSAILQTVNTALVALQDLPTGGETVVDVVNSLERDFLLSLAVTLTGQGVIVQKIREWESGGGDYLDVQTFKLSRVGGQGHVHMRDILDATDAGMATFVRGPGGGFKTFDRNPTLQYMLYSQWFTYMHALWDEQYRVRLAGAHGDGPDGEPWTRLDIRISLFGDIRSIRNDVVHKRGNAHESLKNQTLDWFEEGHRMHPTTEQMHSLVSLFPRTELLAVPTRSEPGKPTDFPWKVKPELVDAVKSRAVELQIPKKKRQEIGNEALEYWLDVNPGPS